MPTNRRASPLRVLFICSRNRRRSPTAEAVFGALPDFETASAGVATDADEVVTRDHIEWAEVICVMEAVHRRKLQRQFGSALKSARIVCLNIPDDFEFMAPELIARLQACAHLIR